MMKILVTGATGMLGQTLVRRLNTASHIIRVSHAKAEGCHAVSLEDKATVEKLAAETSADLVIHTAAYSDVDGCEKNPALAYASNTEGTKNLLHAFGGRKVPFIYVSTDYVFSGKKKTPYGETDPTFPVNVYGVTKLLGEEATKDYPGPVAIVRTSWLFGDGNPRTFVNAIRQRLTKEKVVRVLEDQMDAPTSVEDLSEALIAIGQRLGERARSSSAGREIFHFCNQGGTTRLEMTRFIREKLGLKSVSVEPLDRGAIEGRLAVRPVYTVMSTSHYEEVFHRPIRTWQESLAEYLKKGVS